MKIPWLRVLRFVLPWPRGDWFTEDFVNIRAALLYIINFVIVMMLGVGISGILATRLSDYYVPRPADNYTLYEHLTCHPIEWRALENGVLWAVVFFWLAMIVYRIWMAIMEAISRMTRRGIVRAKARKEMRR
jgi:hypothetical protein